MAQDLMDRWTAGKPEDALGRHAGLNGSISAAGLYPPSVLAAPTACLGRIREELESAGRLLGAVEFETSAGMLAGFTITLTFRIAEELGSGWEAGK